ncbi:MAG: dihydroorotate dehydrogenase electron transfer subunit [Candidatus Omnitrophica bacterium]|nr:dihydroorotate dehydrogenase electron transfer subunit [Candidatus Omnitrophota bacterium]
MGKIMQTKAKVIKNIEVAPKYYRIILFCPQIVKEALPGQFLEIKVTEKIEPFLRRPFSINRISGKHIEILYEIKGKGTRLLSRIRAGNYLDIIGPLGNGFSYQPKLSQGKIILVAGGMGVAPLFFLAGKIKEIKNQKSKIKNLVLIGAKTKKQVLCEQEFKKMGYEVRIATDDGSGGFKGTVTELLKKMLSDFGLRPSIIYACGPRPMLKALSVLSARRNINTQVSLEEHMACGIGACLGCVVKLKTQKSKGKIDFEYRRVCKDGPVFDAREVVW